MSIIKHIIKLNPLQLSGTTGVTTNGYTNIKFSLGSGSYFTGLQQEIDSLTQITTSDLVNSVVDEERRKYKPYSIIPAPSVRFEFYNGSYGSSYIAAGFVTNEYTKNYSNFSNSFFILDLLDSYDINTQSKIFTTYITKKGSSPVFTITGSTSQVYNWFIPESYIDEQTGSTSYAYARFMFYNAKSGNTDVFLNTACLGASTAERMLFKVELNHDNRTWCFTQGTSITARELTTSAQYINKVNDTLGNAVCCLQQSPPSGNTFTLGSSSVCYLIT